MTVESRFSGFCVNRRAIVGSRFPESRTDDRTTVGLGLLGACMDGRTMVGSTAKEGCPGINSDLELVSDSETSDLIPLAPCGIEG